MDARATDPGFSLFPFLALKAMKKGPLVRIEGKKKLEEIYMYFLSSPEDIFSLLF